jgi:hypothetical protein
MKTFESDLVETPAARELLHRGLDYEELADTLGLQTAMGREALVLALANTILLDSKQQCYGSGNISSFGEYGVLVRANDKIERLKNLLRPDSATETPAHESLLDTWFDLSNYSLIGALCRMGRWRKE